MKRRFFLTFTLFCTLFGALAHAQLAPLPDDARFDAPVMLQTGFAGVSLREAVLALAASVGLTAIVDDVPEDATIAYNIPEGRPFRQLWGLVLGLNNLDYVLLENDLVVVGRPAALAPLRVPDGVTTDANGPILQRFYRIEDEAAAIRNFLQAEVPQLSINVLEGANLLSIRGSQAQQDEVAALLEQIAQPGIALEQRLYTLSNARAEDLAAVLQASASSLLQVGDTEEGTAPVTQESDFTVVADPRTNSLIVTAPAATQRRVAELLPQLDAPQPQVNIQVRIQEIQTSTAASLGINLNAGLGTFAATVLETGLNFIFDPQHVLSGLNLGATLNTLEQQGLSRRVDDSNITVLNNVTANFQSGTTLNIFVPSTPNNIEEQINLGVVIEVTPQIADDGRVILTVSAVVDSLLTPVEQIINDPQNRVIFETSKREVSSIVNLLPGQTVLLSGLLENLLTNSVARVPILGSLPIVGGLFTTTSTDETNIDLLVIVTATIVE